MRKAQVSRKLLLSFLLVAVGASLFATFASVSWLQKTGKVEFTGFAPASDTDTATVNLTVDQTLDVNWTGDGLDFGEGSLNPSYTNCTLNTNASGNSAGCNSFADKSSSPLSVRNIGNVNVSLNLSFDVNATTFIGGTSSAFYFLWNDNGTGTSSCTNTTGSHDQVPSADHEWWGNYSYDNNSWHEVNETGVNDYALCKNFLFNGTNADHELFLHFYLTIPTDSNTGNLTATITATGTGVDGQ